MLHALLIDDEAAARADLREKLAAHRDVSIVGEAATLDAARALLASADYDLVFFDVQLIGGDSFQLVSLVRPGASIVFATAHDRYAVRAFQSNAVDYLLKPIDPARLAEALRRVAAARGASIVGTRRVAPDRPARSATSCAPLAPLVVNHPPDISPHFSEVALTGDERVFLRQCLEAWEDSLSPAHWLRGQPVQTARFPRLVRYKRDTEPTRFFVDGGTVSRLRRWCRAIAARFGW